MIRERSVFRPIKKNRISSSHFFEKKKKDARYYYNRQENHLGEEEARFESQAELEMKLIAVNDERLDCSLFICSIF